jgi:hypothetical protein
MPRRNRIIGGFAICFALLVDLTAAATATPFAPGDSITYSQSAWGDPTGDGGTLLASAYDSVYTGNLIVGAIGVGRYSVTFTDRHAVDNYLPSNGTPGPLANDFLDPTITQAGRFGGDVVALGLNIGFGDAGYLPGSHGVIFGDLLISADNSGLPPLAANLIFAPQFYGLSVREVDALAQQALGGARPYSDEYLQAAELLNTSFFNGVPSEWAQRQLFVSTVTSVPEPPSWTMFIGLLLALLLLRLLGTQTSRAQCLITY